MYVRGCFKALQMCSSICYTGQLMLYFLQNNSVQKSSKILFLIQQLFWRLEAEYEDGVYLIDPLHLGIASCYTSFRRMQSRKAAFKESSVNGIYSFSISIFQ